MTCLIPLLLLATTLSAAPGRVFYLNSYHEGYGSSDETMAGIREAMGAAGIELRIFFLDTKRQPAAEQIRARAEAAVAAIREFRPDVLIASDDDAVKYVVVPHFRSGPLPVVFCGVNWSAAQYGLPTATITGMLEVVPVEDALRDLKRAFPDLRKLRVLSEDSTSERSNRELLDPKYRALGLEPSYSLVADFDAWKREFALAQRQADAIYLPTNGAVRGWDRDAAAAWVRANIRKPVFTCDDFMMPYAGYGLTKVAREQGEWAAAAALRILRGAPPSAIPVVSNRQVRCYVNPELAGAVGFTPPSERVCQPRR